MSTDVTLLLIVCGGVFTTSALATLTIKALELDISTALPTTVSIISLAATIFFGIAQMRPSGQIPGSKIRRHATRQHFGHCEQSARQHDTVSCEFSGSHDRYPG